jgi:hypothetical protein
MPINTTGEKDHILGKTDYIHTPRVTWAIDLMPNIPTTDNGNRAALLAVDLFSGYLQVCSLKDKTTDSLLAAIDLTFWNTKIPKIRSRNRISNDNKILPIPGTNGNKILPNLSKITLG